MIGRLVKEHKTFEDLVFGKHPIAVEAENIRDNNAELWKKPIHAKRKS